MAMMRAVAITKPGGPEVLKPVEVERPEPDPGEVLIRVHAAGVNRPDVIQRMGYYPPPPGASPLPGLEVAGEVVEKGPGVRSPALGKQVCALIAGGGYAEYAVVSAAQCLPVPVGLSMVEAAALPETTLTVWHNVFERGQLQKDEWLLVHGGSSGIGTTAIQLAVAKGARVIATAGCEEKCDACVDLGAVRTINYRAEDFVSAVMSFTEGHGADLILDMVGGDYVTRNFKAAAEDGRIVQIAFLEGSKKELDLMPLMLKRLTLTGSTLRARSVDFKAELTRNVKKHVWPLIGAGEYRPVICKTFALEKAADAHRLMESNQHIGKIVLEVGEGA